MGDLARELAPGDVLAGRYRLERRLGEGGMSVVWAAIHTLTRGRVALKLVKPGRDAEELRARLLREARATAAVQHPNVCAILDVTELADGSPVVVMERLSGEPLSRRLEREGKLSLGATAAIGAAVTSAVGAAHALGIVHRDLKPENVFLLEGPPGTKVIDFGVAKLTAPEGAAAATATLTRTGARVGTPHYMAPEQVLGGADVDARADVWALGLVLYRCLSGVLPTYSDTVKQTFKNIVTEPIQPLEEVAAHLPPDVTALVGRMLSRDPKARPSDLHEVAAVLARYTDAAAPSFGACASPGAPPGGGAAAGRTTIAGTTISGGATTIEAPRDAALDLPDRREPSPGRSPRGTR